MLLRLWLCFKRRQWTCQSRRAIKLLREWFMLKYYSLMLCVSDLWVFFDAGNHWSVENASRLNHKPITQVELRKLLVVGAVNKRISGEISSVNWCKLLRNFHSLTQSRALGRCFVALSSALCCRRWNALPCISQQFLRFSRHSHRSSGYKTSRQNFSSLSIDRLQRVNSTRKCISLRFFAFAEVCTVTRQRLTDRDVITSSF